MKPIKNFIITAILFLVFCFTAIFCDNESSKKQQKSIIGDYLFDHKEMNSVFLTTVYEEDGELYAYSELADYPVKMELADAKTH